MVLSIKGEGQMGNTQFSLNRAAAPEKQNWVRFEKLQIVVELLGLLEAIFKTLFWKSKKI